MLLAQTNTNQTGVRKHTLAKTLHVGKVSLRFVTIALFAAVALLYLAQSTQSATRDYQLRAFEIQRTELEKERQRLEVEMVRLRSLETLQKDFSTMPPAEGQPVSWEKVSGVAYVQTPQPVAER